MENLSIMASEEDTRLYAGCFAVVPKGTTFTGYAMDEGFPSLGLPKMPFKKEQQAQSDLVVWVDFVGKSQGKPYVSWDSGKAWATERTALRNVDFAAVAAGVPYVLYPCLTHDGRDDVQEQFAKELAQAVREAEFSAPVAPVMQKIMDRRISGESVSDKEVASLVEQATRKLGTAHKK